jgi:hypothetical protein
MSEELPRQRVLNFLDAFYGGDTAAALKCCDNDIESMVYLPVELFPHLGPRRGKAAISSGPCSAKPAPRCVRRSWSRLPARAPTGFGDRLSGLRPLRRTQIPVNLFETTAADTLGPLAD